jgi:serine/threonine-protein kinase
MIQFARLFAAATTHLPAGVLFVTQLVGRRLGRYEVQQEIGSGGMARVYRAFDTQLQRTVALKVMASQLEADPEFARRFQREAVLAANLRHISVVTVYDVGEHEGLRYIAMEYIQGKSLHMILRERGALGLGYAVSILKPLGAALDYAHAQGAVHRDVKPHNVLIDTDGRVMLADFGIAQPPNAEREGLTRTGIFMGTPEYISPEQAEGQRVGGQSDLYSLAIVAYEIVTGRVPFSGNTPQLILAHVQKMPPQPSSLAPHLPEELNRVLGRALAKRPNERFKSGAALVEALSIVARRHQIALATQSQLATLAAPLDSSAGHSTIAMNEGTTPAGSRPPALVQPTPPPTPAGGLPQPPHRPEDSALTPDDLAALGLAEQAAPPSYQAPRPAAQQPPLSAPPQISQPASPPPPSPPTGRTASGGTGGGDRRFTPLTIAMIVVLLVVAVVLIFFIFNAIANEPGSNPGGVTEPASVTETATPSPTTTRTARPSPTNEPTATATRTARPTTTETPTEQPADSPQPTSPPVPTSPPPEPPTNTPVLPTDTPVLPTDTPTLRPSPLPLPSHTPTVTQEPTATPPPTVTEPPVNNGGYPNPEPGTSPPTELPPIEEPTATTETEAVQPPPPTEAPTATPAAVQAQPTEASVPTLPPETGVQTGTTDLAIP